MARRVLLGLFVLLVLAVAPAAHACGSSGYSYAGVSSQSHVFGVSAALTALASPAVQNGHVAGWVGVGGPGLGPHGSSEWIQVGFSGFPGLSVGSLYYEVTLPGGRPRYFEVLSNVAAGARHSVAVLEVGRQHEWWRVWVDGRAVSRPFHLPGSHGAWRGIATAESWGGGMRACNRYAYRFQHVSVVGSPGGAWNRLHAVYRMQQGANRLLMSSSSTFVAKAGTLPTTRVLADRRRPSTRTTNTATHSGAGSASSAVVSSATPADTTAVPPAPVEATPAPVDPPGAPDGAPSQPVDGSTQNDFLTALGVTP